jgi:hypothetical protein
MIKKFFILIAIGIVFSIIPNNAIITQINQNKYPKINQILNRIELNIKYYTFMNYELDAIEYLINKLNIPNTIKKKDFFYSFDPDSDVEIIIPVITSYLYFSCFKQILSKIFTKENFNLKKLKELKEFIKNLNLNEEITNKLLDAEYNYNEDFLKSVLNENDFTQYKELLKMAEDELWQSMDSIKITHQEINDFIINLEKFLEIKISNDRSFKKSVKRYLRQHKRYYLHSHYEYNTKDDYFFHIFKRFGTTASSMGNNYNEINQESLTIMIINEIIQYKFKIKIYPLVNQLKYFNVLYYNLISNKEMEENKDLYEQQLKENNINWIDITDFLWDNHWDGFPGEEGKSIIDNLIVYKKKIEQEKQERKLKKNNK